MARPIWQGAISFGLVTVPVGLFSATEDHTYHFHQFERGTGDRIRYRRVNERTGKEVEQRDIVKGYDLGGGEHVIVEPEELQEIAPGRSRTLEIQAFVDLDQVDPMFFQRTYWLAPSDEQHARAYDLLRQALEKTNRVGIATFVMRSKEYLAAIRAHQDVLALETLHFADEIRNPREQLPRLPEAGQAAGRELDMAVELINVMTDDWRPEQYQDTYTERVGELIAGKREGRTVSAAEPPPRATEVVDLQEALRRSMHGSKRGRRASPGGNGQQGGNGRQGEDGQQQDLSGLNKSELERMARELDISGRSKMTRAQLEDAVARERGTAGGRRRRKAS